MTPTRLRECLALLRWSQRGLAEALNRDEGWVRMMARGTRPVPPALAGWLERMATVHDNDPPPLLEDGRRRVMVVGVGAVREVDTATADAARGLRRL